MRGEYDEIERQSCKEVKCAQMDRSASGVDRQPDDDGSTRTPVGNDLGPLLLAQAL